MENIPLIILIYIFGTDTQLENYCDNSYMRINKTEEEQIVCKVFYDTFEMRINS